MKKISTLLLLILVAANAAAQDVLIIESTVTGSQEEPKVLSIVPWQEPEDPSYIGEDVEGVGDSLDVFQTLDRDSFNRERLYILSARKTLQNK
ncbi:Uncharacterised protein [BD1-7 clade bacterium]|uniref:Uncharacterized protein n=1 Tax=BD1-7 clade bacterium TaxID=2029982 RepID=A0A5S9NJC3_9GAMM|nr:Uncharacterised protein [BD1-7 clade bacterium]CAA0093334.1 Uncharacterised protein [BD1-7 clade bacterium]